MATKSALMVKDIVAGSLDYCGQKIVCVYSYSPPDYAVYRTDARVMVQFADNKEMARQQRLGLRSIAELRGEVTGLVDGWHVPATQPWWHTLLNGPPPPPPTQQIKRRADSYERRVADAIVNALEGDGDNAVRLLSAVKNDIISERSSLGRRSYLMAAALCALFILILTTILAHGFDWVFPAQTDAVWTAVSGGTFGAFFSIAIGIQSRTVLIDLQNRDNRADAAVRMLIGAIAGGVLLILLVTNLIAGTVVNTKELLSAETTFQLTAFAIGFLGGFSERLVPDALTKTKLGTKEPSQDASSTPGRPKAPHGPGPGGAGSGGQTPGGGVTPTTAAAAGAAGDAAPADGAAGEGETVDDETVADDGANAPAQPDPESEPAPAERPAGDLGGAPITGMDEQDRSPPSQGS
jgi:hypothetical protein